ncbi:MAG: NAD-dependent DNA ligase LigA [Rikenellaceae bacterium]
MEEEFTRIDKHQTNTESQTTLGTTVKLRVEELRKNLNFHNQKYYVENAPEISDYEFDMMLRELQELEREHPELADINSPSRRVGSDLTSEFQSAKHRYAMLSLSNTYTMEELSDFIRKVNDEVGDVKFVCELKFDGTAISLTYEDGALTRAVTRGDGVTGDDVTANVRTIRSVPLVLLGEEYPPLFEIRGEILMPYASFERLNAEREAAAENPFANARNAAAGSLKQQSSAVVAKRGLDCMLYQIVGDSLPYNSHWQSLEAVKKYGFKVSECRKLCSTLSEIEEFIAYWDKERANLPFATDGVVVKVDSYSAQRELGFTAKAPKWAVAYKFKAEQALTKLTSVDFQVGRTGAITPVANLEAVPLAGTTVKRASLHNAEQIAALDIRVGDMVYVEKGGEIIPKIVGVELSARAEDTKPFEYITNCPECDTRLIKIEGEAKHYCPNEAHCPPQIIGRIIHFIRRKAMNIDGLGDETVELLYDNKLVTNIADLYSLRAEQLSVLPRLGDKSAQNIVASIKGSTEVPFERVLFGLGIRFVGETTAKYLASHLRSIEAIMEATYEELCEAQEVGDKIAKAIINHFSQNENRELIERLRQAGVQLSAEEATLLSNSLEGRSFVVSGKFVTLSRDELKASIEAHGGRNLSAISKSVDFLIAGDKMGPAKLQKAQRLGVTIISESQFIEMLDSPNEGAKEEMKEEAKREVKETVKEQIEYTDGDAKQGSLF